MPLIHNLLIADGLVRMARFAGHPDHLVPRGLSLAALCRAVVSLLPARLADEGLAHAAVHGARCCAGIRVHGAGVSALLAVAAEDIVVVRLRGDGVDGVRLVCAVRRRRARGEDLCVEVRRAVVAGFFAAELVLQAISQHVMLEVLENGAYPLVHHRPRRSDRGLEWTLLVVEGVDVACF